MDFIPVSTPSLSAADVDAVAACVREGWISSEGPQVPQFEEEFASLIGSRHAIAVANGTAALDLALEAVGIGPGYEVILPSFTIISCLNHILRSGAKPVFVDAQADTWNSGSQAIKDAVTPNTKAIIVVHIYGLPADIDEVVTFAQERGIAVIEDSAEAHGQHLNAKALGSYGTLSTFSFYSNKLITTGEGGMVLTNDAHLAGKVRSLRNLSFSPQRRFVHENVGWNYRMTAMQAALGLSQLGRLEELLKYKKEIGEYYQEGLSDLPAITKPLPSYRGSENVYWVFGVVLDSHLSAIDVMAALRDKGVGTRPFFFPLHRQPVLEKFGWGTQTGLPVSEWLGERGLYLPNGANLTDDHKDYVIKCVHEIVGS